VSHVAILGAGPIGASLAHRLAGRGRVAAITLIDSNESAASGKALDITQSGPVERFGTRVGAAGDVLASSSASVIVVADEIEDGEWEGDRGLALLDRLRRAGTRAPIVFPGAHQLWLMEKGYRELGIEASRLVGTAPSAMVSALRAWAGLELSLASVDVTAVGRPPALVVAWSTATAGGAMVTDRVPAHRLLALSDRLTRLWPPGPFATASATAPIVEALVDGSRRLHVAVTVVDGDLGARGRAVLLPLDLVSGQVRGFVLPSLSPQERTELQNAVAD
jgi:malate dehydrogenase